MTESLTPAERRMRAQLAVHSSWAKTPDRAGRTASARSAFLERFEREVDPAGELDPAERARRAESAKKAYFTRLAYRSSRARKKNRLGAGDQSDPQAVIQNGGPRHDHTAVTE